MNDSKTIKRGNPLPDGTVRIRNCGVNSITQKKENGKWVTIYKDKKDYIKAENSPIGKSGPRTELRKLIYGFKKSCKKKIKF